jgi:hypothetical protein
LTDSDSRIKGTVEQEFFEKFVKHVE